MANYSIIWKHFDKESKIGLHLKANEGFSLPYFIDGTDKDAFEKKLPVDLHAVHLIRGLLVGYFDKPPEVDTSFAKQKAKELINEHLGMFGASSIEDFILDLSFILRDKNGQEASLQVLMAGIEILPDSHLIKYDCCLDLLNCIEDDVVPERLAGIQKLRELLSVIDSTKIHPDLLGDLEVMKSEATKLI